MVRSQLDFVRQQGFTESEPIVTQDLYAALMFQPRVIGVVVLAGILLQNPEVFLVLSAVLWWSAFVPSHNPFDAFYNRLIAPPRHLPPLRVAPAPRRFAQSVAATLALAIGAALLTGASTLAWVFEGLLSGGMAALVFGDFCAGSFVYHLLQTPLLTKKRPVSPSSQRFSPGMTQRKPGFCTYTRPTR